MARAELGTSALTSLTPPGRTTAHTFTYTPQTTTYAPPLATGMTKKDMKTTFSFDRQIDLVDRADNKTLDFVYDTAVDTDPTSNTGQLQKITTDQGTISFRYWSAPSCSTLTPSDPFCNCSGSGCAAGRVKNISGPSTSVSLDFQYQGPLTSQWKQTVPKTTGTQYGTLDWTYTPELLQDSEKVTWGTSGLWAGLTGSYTDTISASQAWWALKEAWKMAFSSDNCPRRK